MIKKILLFIGVAVILGGFIPRLSIAEGTITNTANLVYKDNLGGTYTGVDTCVLKKLIVKVEIDKKARNITKRGTGTEYYDPENGVAGDIIEYRVVLSNTGEDIARYVVMTDTLPGTVTYQAGSIKVDGVIQTDQYEPPDDKANYGKIERTITVGKNEAGDNGNGIELSINSGNSVTILYRVKID